MKYVQPALLIAFLVLASAVPAFGGDVNTPTGYVPPPPESAAQQSSANAAIVALLLALLR